MFTFIALLFYILGLGSTQLLTQLKRRSKKKQLLQELYWSGCQYF